MICDTLFKKRKKIHRNVHTEKSNRMIHQQYVRYNLVEIVLNKLRKSVILQKSNNIYGFLLIASVQKSEKINKHCTSDRRIQNSQPDLDSP